MKMNNIDIGFDNCPFYDPSCEGLDCSECGIYKDFLEDIKDE